MKALKWVIALSFLFSVSEGFSYSAQHGRYLKKKHAEARKQVKSQKGHSAADCSSKTSVALGSDTNPKMASKGTNSSTDNTY